MLSVTKPETKTLFFSTGGGSGGEKKSHFTHLAPSRGYCPTHTNFSVYKGRLAQLSKSSLETGMPVLGDTAAASLPPSPRPAEAGGTPRLPGRRGAGRGAPAPRSPTAGWARRGPHPTSPHLSPAPPPGRHARPLRARRKPPP